MKHKKIVAIFLFSLFTLLITACGTSPAPEQREPLNSPTSPPTARPSPTATSIPPTSTLPPTPTPEPTAPPAPNQPPIEINNLANVRPVLELGDGNMSVVAPHPAGRVFAVGGTQGIWIYGTFSLNLVGHITGHSAAVSALAWDPAGERLVSGSDDRTVRIWDVRRILDGTSSYADQTHFILAHGDVIRDVDWSPDGTLLVSASDDRHAIVWRIPSLDDKETDAVSTLDIFHLAAVYTVQFHPTKPLLLTGDFDGVVHVFNVDTGEEHLEPQAHVGWINMAKWSPDGNAFASVGIDRSIHIWDVVFRSDGNPREAVERPVISTFTNFNALAWTVDGENLVTGGGTPFDIVFWDVLSPTEIQAQDVADEADRISANEIFRLEGHVKAVTDLALFPTGALVTTSQDSTLRFWNLRNGAGLRGITPASSDHTERLQSVEFSPDDAYLATGGSDSLTRIWDAQTGARLHVLPGHTDSINALAWSVDGQFLATAGNDGNLLVWETGDLTAPLEPPRVLEGQGGRLNAVAWDPFGTQVATGGLFQLIQVWDAVTNQPSIDLFTDYEISALAWSPSGTIIAAGSQDGTIHLWDIPSVSETIALESGQFNPIVDLQWGASTDRLVSMNAAGAVTLWDAGSGQIIYTTGSTHQKWDFAISPDQSLIAVGSDNTLIYFIDFETGDLVYAMGGHMGDVRALDWSSSGDRLASASADGAAKVWLLPEVGATPDAFVLSPLPLEGDSGPSTLAVGPLDAGNITDLEGIARLGRGSIEGIDLHFEGRYLAVAAGNGAWIYDLDTYEPVRFMPGNKTYAVEWAPGGQYLAAREIQNIILYNPDSGQPVQVFPTGLGVSDDMAWSPDGSLVAAGNFLGEVRLWAAASGEVLGVWGTGGTRITDLEFSPDGRTLGATSGFAATGEGRLWLFDVPTGKMWDPLLGHKSEAVRLAWDILEKTVLYSYGIAGELIAWDMTVPLTTTVSSEDPPGDGEEIEVFIHPHEAISLTVDARIIDLISLEDGELLAIYQDGSLIQSSFELMAEAIINSFVPSTVADVEIHPSGQLIAALNSGAIYKTTDQPTPLGFLFIHPGDVQGFDVGGEGYVFAGGDDGTARIWDYGSSISDTFSNTKSVLPGSSQPAQSLDFGEPIRDIKVSPKKGYAAVRTETGIVKLLDAGGALVSEVGAAGEISPDYRVAWSPDGLTLALNAAQGVEIWNAEANLLVSTLFDAGAADQKITVLAYSPDGTRLAVGTDAGTIQIWGLAESTLLRSYQAYSGKIHTIAWAPESRTIALGGSDGSDFAGVQFVRLYGDTGARLLEMELPFAHEALALIWNGRGTLLFSGDSFGQLQVWDPASGQLLFAKDAHPQAITGIGLSPTENLLFSASRDGTVRIWGRVE